VSASGPPVGMQSRSVPGILSKCTGFIFCEFFSNLGATGCRRGRTPERPLRQPSRSGYQARPFLILRPVPPVCGPMLKRSKVTNWYRKVLRSQEGCLYGGKRLVSVSLSNGRGGTPGGRTHRHPMCLVRSRVRLPNSAGRRLAGNVPGESGGGGTSGSLSHARG
jgi:hypothetical protein